MSGSEKLLFAILKTIPFEKEKLSTDKFDAELLSMGVKKDSKVYNFLFDNNIIEINKSKFIPLKENSNFKITISEDIKYINLTKQGEFILFILQSNYLIDKFIELGDD